MDADRRRLTAIAPLFAVSGASGLIYQVLWVREFGHVLGNTLPSATLVTSVFLGGLGLGSYLAGKRVDRAHDASPGAGLLMYAKLELVVAAFGFLVSVTLRAAGPRLASLSTYTCNGARRCELGAATWLMNHVFVVALLLLPCVAMGATLTALVRYVVADRTSEAGRRIGLLYGANTLGAALGALATDLVLVPRIGIAATEGTAVMLNVFAGTAALAVHRASFGRVAGSVVPAATAEVAPPPSGDASGARALVRLTALALALSGAAAMGLEIVFFRYLSQVLGSLRAVFSLLVAVLLVATFAGALLAGVLSERVKSPAWLWQIAQASLGLGTLAVFLFLDPARPSDVTDAARVAIAAAAEPWRTLQELAWSAKPIVVVVALPGFLMGFAFPLANAHVQREAGAVGRRTGVLYLGNTIGNVAGGTLVGLALIPTIGIHATTATLVGLAAAAMVPMHLSTRTGARETGRADVLFAGAFLTAGLAAVAFGLLGGSRMLAPALPPSDGGTRKVSEPTEGPYETIAIADVPGLEQVLFTNGHSMSATSDTAQRYMRAMVSVPMLLLDDPRRVLVICFGVGNTAHAASLHPSIERLDIADLSRHVLSYAPRFAATNGAVLDDPRVHVFVNDGRHHLAMTAPATYDLVTLEPPPIGFAGVSSLYTREFFQLVHARLREGGIITEWLPAYQVGGAAVEGVVRAFVEVFPDAVLLSGDDRELVLVGRKGRPLVLDPDVMERRLSAAKLVRADLERVDMGSLLEIAGAFAGSAATLRAATAQAQPMTDDRPLLEHGLVWRMQMTRQPEAIFDPMSIDAFCPTCRARIAGLEPYLRVRAKIYRSEAFLRRGDPAAEGPTLDADDHRAIDASTYLPRLFSGPGYLARRAARRALDRKRVGDALVLLQRASYLEPGHPDTNELFALAFLARGDPRMAEVALRDVLAAEPDHPGANRILCAQLTARGEARAAKRPCELAGPAAPAPP